MADINENLAKHGPALVSQFEVPIGFELKHSHIDESSIVRGKLTDIHSMLLIATREEDDRYFLLLQNWWVDQQFVELSLEYFTACKVSGY